MEDARAQAIFARVAAVAGAVRDNIPYTLTVLEGEEPAAFALPGGFVYVTTGLVEALDDGQLAGVLAHELVHTVYSHSLLQLSVVASLEQLGATLAAGSDDTVALLADIGTLLLSLGYSRSQEAEADRVGQQWAAAAGFHPLGLAQALRVLDGEAAGGRWLAYLSTHPPTRQRIAALEGAAAAEAAAPGGTGAPAGRPAPAAAGSRWIALLTLLAAGSVFFAHHRPEPIKPGEHPHYHPVLYAADVLLPIINLGQESAFKHQGLGQWVASVLILLGWVLATAVVAGVTRVLTRT
ncbi:MAG: M48 family metallopeptidase [Limnochordales bacterium]